MNRRYRLTALIIIVIFLIDFFVGYPLTIPIIEYRARTIEAEPIRTSLSDKDILSIYKMLLDSRCDTPYFLDPIVQPIPIGGLSLTNIYSDETGVLPINLLDTLRRGCNIRFGRYEDVADETSWGYYLSGGRDYLELSVPKVYENGTVYVEFGSLGYDYLFVDWYALSKTRAGQWERINDGEYDIEIGPREPTVVMGIVTRYAVIAIIAIVLFAR